MKLSEILIGAKENAIFLKENLTAEQKNKLDFSKLKPFVPDACLFAQLFGRHDTANAIEFMPKTVKMGMQMNFLEEMLLLSRTSRTEFDRFIFDHPRVVEPNSTPIELFLMLKTNSEELFAFIKDETDSFEPRMLSNDEFQEFKAKVNQETQDLQLSEEG